MLFFWSSISEAIFYRTVFPQDSPPPEKKSIDEWIWDAMYAIYFPLGNILQASEYKRFFVAKNCEQPEFSSIGKWMN